MRRIAIAAAIAAALGLGGCSSTDTKPEPLANGGAGQSGHITDLPPAPQPVIDPQPKTTPEVSVSGQYIDAEKILDKLEEIGCRLEKIDVREVKRGGHFSANCKVDDPLNASIEDL